ncbi:MAG: HDIG domain-containing protein [Deltaproteobacteria bacterium]|nr:HDIG domain-containing protein [Deltaproteobacteria bacterium]
MAQKKEHQELKTKILGLPTPMFYKITGLSFLTCLVLGLFIVPSFLFSPKAYEIGETVQETIKSKRTYEDIIDEEHTQEKLAAAQAAVKDVFDYDKNLFSKKAQRISESFKILREKDMKTEKDILDGKVFLENNLNIKIEDQLFYYLRLLHFRESIETAFVHLLKNFDQEMIVSSVENQPKTSMTLRDIEGKAGERLYEDIQRIKIKQDIQKIIERDKETLFAGYKIAAVVEFSKFTKSLIEPNLTFNKEQTDFKRVQAKKSVQPIVIRLLKGDIIVSRGEQIQKRHLIILKHIYDKSQQQRMTRVVFSIALLLFLLFYILFWYGMEYLSTFKLTLKDLGVLAILLFGTVGCTKIFFFVVDGFMDQYSRIPLSAYQYAVPVAVTAMIVRLLMSPQVGLLYSVVLSVLFGFILEQNFLYSLYTFSACIVGIMSVAHVKQRTDVFIAGLKIGFINMISVSAILLMQSSELTFDLKNSPFDLAAAFLSGGLSSFIVTALVPLFEVVFNYTTDLKLLELCNHNHPLLRRLSLETPGTYHHSLLVGTLADAAASEIGVNPLLARVGAYYHDIGKMVKPNYYIENQAGMSNPHDDLNARMSSLIITAHVKEGLDLADQYRLGQPVKDAISQHHGKTVIRYFYNRAVESQDPEMGEVDPNDYRYPGPKPQTREVALVMLADAVEAASRTLTKPNPERMKATCEKIIFGFFQDGQLDECDLTLKDLNTIIECFTRILMGIYHQRIVYPGEPREDQHSEKPKDSQNSESQGKKILKALGTRASDRRKS